MRESSMRGRGRWCAAAAAAGALLVLAGCAAGARTASARSLHVDPAPGDGVTTLRGAMQRATRTADAGDSVVRAESAAPAR